MDTKELVLSGGKFFLWMRIISSLVAATIAFAVVIYFQFFYRNGWAQRTEKVETVQCGLPSTVSNCTGDNNTNCTKHEAKTCTLTVDTFPEKMQMRYNLSQQSVPSVGDAVLVYYNKSRPSEATLDPPWPKTLIIVIASVVCLLLAGGAALMYVFRNNEVAQGIAAIDGVAGIIKRA